MMHGCFDMLRKTARRHGMFDSRAIHPWKAEEESDFKRIRRARKPGNITILGWNTRIHVSSHPSHHAPLVTCLCD